jgi:radical SAM protein with 4Fe4S-binding SPASM domain
MKEEYNYLINKKDFILFSIDEDKYMFYSHKSLILRIKDRKVENYLNICDGGVVDEKVMMSFSQMKEVYNSIVSFVDNIPSKVITGEKKGCIDPSILVLNFSGRCNLKCKYCFVQENDAFPFEDMSIDTALKSVQFLVNNFPNKKNYHISLFGGEPLLMVDSIEQFFSEVKGLYPYDRFTFSITTNGTILNQRIINIIKEYDVSLLISIDGDEKITNENRPFKNGEENTFKVIMRNIEKLKLAGIKNFSLRATIVCGEDLVKKALFFESLKVMYNMTFCFPAPGKDSRLSKWDKEIGPLKIEINRLMDFYYHKICDKNFIYAEYLLEQLRVLALREVRRVSCSCGHKMIAVNADASIYSCMNYAAFNNAKIGSLEEGIDLQRNDFFRAKDVEKLNACNECPYRYLCSGNCVAESFIMNNTPDVPVRESCIVSKVMWEAILILFQKIKNKYPSVIDQIAKHKLIYENV